MPPLITSTANKHVKWLSQLHAKPRQRRSEKLIIVEGAKEITAALEANFSLNSLFCCPDLFDSDFDISSMPTTAIYEVSRSIFAKIAYRQQSDGLIALFDEPALSLDLLQNLKNPLLLIAESIEKPGNLGALIRTADASNCSAVIISDERCDIWNPNAIRASVGTIFTTPVIKASNNDILAFLQKQKITPYAAALTQHSIPYTRPNYTHPTAFVVGTEHSGLSEFWLTHAQPIIIPMLGKNDSLNVSVATGILTYEAVRQRGD